MKKKKWKKNGKKEETNKNTASGIRTACVLSVVWGWECLCPSRVGSDGLTLEGGGGVYMGILVDRPNSSSCFCIRLS